MREIASRPALRTLAIMLLLFQALLPGAVAMAQASGMDMGRFLCLTPGAAPSDEAKRFAQELAELLGDEAPAEPEPTNDCPLCVLATAKLLAPDVEVALPVPVAVETPFAPRAPGLVQRRHGPSLGGRAPPRSI